MQGLIESQFSEHMVWKLLPPTSHSFLSPLPDEGREPWSPMSSFLVSNHHKCSPEMVRTGVGPAHPRFSSPTRFCAAG